MDVALADPFIVACTTHYSKISEKTKDFRKNLKWVRNLEKFMVGGATFAHQGIMVGGWPEMAKHQYHQHFTNQPIPKNSWQTKNKLHQLEGIVILSHYNFFLRFQQVWHVKGGAGCSPWTTWFQPHVTFKKIKKEHVIAVQRKYVHLLKTYTGNRKKNILPQFQEDFPSKGSAQIAIRTSQVSQ